MNRQNQRGVTLYELLITAVIIGIILAFGVPNMVEYRQNSRITATANDLIAAFQLARTEAARAKDNITICGSTAPMDEAAAACDGAFDDGYIVFVDTDGDIVRDAGESILRAHEAAQPGIELAIAGDATFFSFGPTGLGRGDVNGATAVTQIVVCDERGIEIAAGGSPASRLFVTTPLGRATISRDATAITSALTLMSKACPSGG